MTNFPVTRSPKEDRERCPYSWTLSRQFLLPQIQASQLPGFLTLTSYLSGAGNSAICFLPLKFYISNHWTKKHFSLGPYWSLKCSALSQSVEQGRSERPSSALVALDIKYNWVDKSSMLPYEYLLHLLSFWRGCGRKKNLTNECSPWLQFIDILSPVILLTMWWEIFFLQFMLMQREFEILPPSLCPQFNL